MRPRNSAFAIGIVVALVSSSAAAQVVLGMPPVDGSDGRSATPMQRALTDQASREAMEKIEKTRKAATDLVTALGLSCEVKSVRAVAAGPAVVAGKTIETNTYEVSCGSGMGYFLISQEAEKPIAFSCFGAGARAKDTEADVDCLLPANADLKSMASSAMTRAGTPCATTDLSWMGHSETNAVEYVELSCPGGKGYILTIGLSGAAPPIQIASCADALFKTGLACRLLANTATANAITYQTFKAALASHGVPCDVEQVHAIGQENVRKRYVVEFQCPQQPNGLVALIPLDGNDNKFETFDCATAAKFGVACKFAAKN